jgi:sugar lactone lactonase YvrE
MDGPALPDGMAVDTDGHVWVAHFRSGLITRHAPSGAVVSEQQLPTPFVASLAFGGPGGDDLLVTTGTYGVDSWGGRDRYPVSGSIFHDRPGVRGVPTNLFGSA